MTALASAVTAGVLLSFAVALIATRRKEPSFFWLIVFLALLAANQASELLAALDPDRDAAWRAVAAIFAAVDPVALYLFAARALPTSGLNGARPLAIACSLGGALAILAAFGVAFEAARLGALVARELFTGVIYLAVAGAFYRATGPATAAWRPVAVAAVIAALPVWFRLPPEALFVAQRSTGWTILVEPWLLILQMASFVAAAVTLFFWTPPSRRRALFVACGATALLTMVLWSHSILFNLARSGLFSYDDDLVPLGQAAASLRLLVFAILLSIAVLRHDALGVTPTRRRLASRLLLGGAAVSLITILLMTLRENDDTPVLAIVAIVISVALSQMFTGLLDHASSAIYLIPSMGTENARQAAYLAASQRIAALRGIDPNDSELARLRDELGLTEPIAQALHRVAESSATPSFSPGALFATRYRIRRPLNNTRSAFVATDETLGRDVVLKTIDARDAGEHARAMREGRAIAGARHPGVVTIHDVISTAGCVVLVMEYVPGGDVSGALDRLREAPEDAQRAFSAALFSALATLHAIGIVHGDIKPTNILLDRNGGPLLADFGLASAAKGKTAVFGEAYTGRGTIGFAAPEILEGGPVTTASDVYAAAKLVHLACPQVAAKQPALFTAALSDAPAERPNADVMASAVGLSSAPMQK